MKRSALGLIYLIQGMRNAGIDVDSRLADIGIKVDSLDPSSTIHDSLEWDIQQIISENVDPERFVYWATLCISRLWSIVNATCNKSRYTNCPGKRDTVSKLTHLFGTLSLQETEKHIILNYLPVDLKQKSVYSVPNAKFRVLISLFKIFIQ